MSRNSLAVLTGDIRLKATAKCLVHDAATVARIQHGGSLTARVMVENVESRNEELVSVLLLVAGKMAGMGPHKVEQLERDVWSDLT